MSTNAQETREPWYPDKEQHYEFRRTDVPETSQYFNWSYVLYSPLTREQHISCAETGPDLEYRPVRLVETSRIQDSITVEAIPWRPMAGELYQIRLWDGRLSPVIQCEDPRFAEEHLGIDCYPAPNGAPPYVVLTEADWWRAILREVAQPVVAPARRKGRYYSTRTAP